MTVILVRVSYSNLCWYVMLTQTNKDGNMAGQISFFGESHRDRNDFPGSLSCMIPTSDLQQRQFEEPGRFHLLTRGVYVNLDPFCPIFFSGLLPHGGTSSIAPPGETAPAWAHRSVFVAYSPQNIMNGTTRHSFTDIPRQAVPLHISPEMVGVM